MCERYSARMFAGRTLVVLFCCAWLTVSHVSAQEAESESPYKLDLHVDLPLIALSGGVSAAGFLVRAELPECAPYCSTKGLNALDRTAIHLHSNTAAKAADVALVVLAIAPLVLDAIDTRFHGFWSDAVVIFETLALTTTITQITKFAVGRYEPIVYSGAPGATQLQDFDVGRSFFSAHAASAFAVTTAFTVTYWLRHPDDPMRFVVLALGATLSLLTGVSKVFAGQHFWTDVLAGSVVGASVGVLVPFLHVRTD